MFFTFLNGWRNPKNISWNVKKIFAIQVSASINKSWLQHKYWQKLYVLQILKHLLSGPFWKKFINSWSRHVFLLQDKMWTTNSNTKLKNWIADESLGSYLELCFLYPWHLNTWHVLHWQQPNRLHAVLWFQFPLSVLTCPGRHREFCFQWLWKMTDGFLWCSAILGIL